MKTIFHHAGHAPATSILCILSLMCVSWVLMMSAAAQSPEPANDPSSMISPGPPDSPNVRHEAQPDTADPMTDIHDLKPLIRLGANPMIWLYILIAAGILALFITLFLIWKKRRKQATEDIAVCRPPEEIAQGALNALADMKLEDGRVFYFRLSAILRGYIEARYAINALEMTSEEFLPEIEKLGTDRQIQQNLRELIRTTDPIKFAGQMARGDKMQEDMAFVKDYVDRTTPVPNPAEQELAENV
jgi:hypothetical protein